jgi:16S rRNA A1518/A1519 N6-dimethyltransferase RsmA/KsgA/DIM1 with predicted DNA glycosylase/AP lyase activity
MIAPRKHLWSTPVEAVDYAIEVLNLGPSDVLYDIGAGDGRFVMRALEASSCSVVGVEIDSERCRSISDFVELHEWGDRCRVICANALDVSYDDATAFFLYLIPRGLSLIFRHVLTALKGRPIKVVTYMAPLPAEVAPKSVSYISTPQHPEARWPVYYYELIFP